MPAYTHRGSTHGRSLLFDAISMTHARTRPLLCSNAAATLAAPAWAGSTNAKM